MAKATARAQNVTTTGSITSSNTTSTQSTSSAASSSTSNKIFYLFSAEHEGVNQTKLGIPPDKFSPDDLEVNEGDNVTINFYNLDTTDRHTFTIGPPYNINEDLLPGTNATFTFKATDDGIYRF
jgi:plastocyanin